MTNLDAFIENKVTHKRDIEFSITDPDNGQPLVTFDHISLFQLFTMICRSFESGYGIKARRTLTREELAYYDSFMCDESGIAEEREDAEAEQRMDKAEP